VDDASSQLHRSRVKTAATPAMASINISPVFHPRFDTFHAL